MTASPRGRLPGSDGRRGPRARPRTGHRRPALPRDRRRVEAAARSRLKRFRQGSVFAIGVTALVLFLTAGPTDAPAAGFEGGPAVVVGAPAGTPGQDPGPAAAADTAAATQAAGDTLADPGAADPGESARRATGTLRALLRDFYGFLPALGIALALLVVAAILARLVRMGLRAALASWQRADATAALVAVAIWLLALGAALSVLAGDARALVGSVGLFGLALSWALQTPIESFTGWLLNSFRSYYRIGDRIAVGDVFGDVTRIDFLTTTVFEAGGPEKRVQAAQATGALITFPNSEVLRSNITNFTRDFPYVWDEMIIAVANESDIPLAARVLERTAAEVVGDQTGTAAAEYVALLHHANLAWDVAAGPEIFIAARDSWTDLTIRYLVPAREMRRWATRLLLAVNEAMARPDVRDRVFPAYPRNQVQPIPAPFWAQESHEEAGRGGGADGTAPPGGPRP